MHKCAVMIESCVRPSLHTGFTVMQVQTGEKSGKWTCGVVEESLKAASVIETDNECDVMCERRFMIWSQDPAQCTWKLS